MKKILLLFCAFVTFGVSAQFYNGEAWYRLGNPDSSLFMTVNTTTGALSWEAPLTGADAARQQWAIEGHVTPISSGLVQAVATVAGSGNFTLGTIAANVSTGGTTAQNRMITLTANAGDPVSDAMAANYGFDQFQRRRTGGTSAPSGQNDAIFIVTPTVTGSRFGVTPASGAAVQFDGGAVDLIVYDRIRDLGEPFVPPSAGPSITLLGATTVDISVGSTYTDAGATADDGSGNDITNDIVVVNPVDANTIGVYTVTYNVTNGGTAAPEVTRTVNVNAAGVIASAQTGNWNDTATWTGGIVPTSSDDVEILANMQVSVNDAQAANSVKVAGGSASLTVTTGGALSISGDIFTQRFDDGVVIRSATSVGAAMGTLILGGNVFQLNSDGSTSTSNRRVTIRKTLTNDNFHLVSQTASTQPRVNRMTNSDFRTNATSLALAVYNNANASGAKYSYFTSGTLTNADEVKLGSGASVSVSGTDNTNTTGEFQNRAFYSHGSSVDVAISTDAGTGDGFNLVGNPFLSNLYGNTNANATNMLSQNSGVLEEATFWFWNGDTNSFITRNQSSSAFTIPSITGFFVKSNATGGNFTITQAMETHNISGNVLSKKVSERFEIDLSVSNGKKNTTTSVKFIDNTTAGFDNGYDSSTFGGDGSASFEVYTELLENNSGKSLAIQSLPSSDIDNTVVPVGVKANGETEITFSAEALNVPAGYSVYLEDRSNGEFTKLDDVNAEYTATVSGDTKGRFFLHTKSAVLSTDSELLGGVSVYSVDNSTLRITGLANGQASVSVVSILGSTVLNTTFNASNTHDISLPNLTAGVYVVKVNTTNGSINKKIILE